MAVAIRIAGKIFRKFEKQWREGWTGLTE